MFHQGKIKVQSSFMIDFGNEELVVAKKKVLFTLLYDKTETNEIILAEDKFCLGSWVKSIF